MDTYPRYNDSLIDTRIAQFFSESRSGQIYLRLCEQQGEPCVIDHITIRCLNIDEEAKPFLAKGYSYQDELVEYPDQGWWAKVYRHPSFPTLFIDQAYDDKRGEKSIIPAWVRRFGSNVLHHVAVLVTDIDKTVKWMRDIGGEFSGEVVGARGTRLRQIFTAAEVRDNAPFTVLELTERNGYAGFYPEQANRLMESSVTKQSGP